MRKAWVDLEAQLGRPLDPKERGLVDDLNTMPPAMVEEARRMVARYGRMDAFSYLSYIATDPNWEYLTNFLEDVVEKRGDAAAWRVGTAFCYLEVPEVRELLGRTHGDVQKQFDALEGERWFFVVPSARDWREDFAGAVGVVVEPVTYRSKRPTGFARLKWSPTSIVPELKPAPDLAVALARWMALRIATRCEPSQRGSEADVLAALGLESSSVSESGAAAIRGLVREEQVLGGPKAGEVPGFRGPDEWFGA